MRDMRKLAASMLALALVIGLALVAYRALTSSETATTVAEKATDQATDSPSTPGTSDDAMMLADYDATVYTDLGEPVTLTSVAGDKPLVINFWATWCPYCIEEMPSLKTIFHEYEDKVNFAFVDVADGERERVEDAKTWLADNGFDDLPAYYDSDLAATRSLGVWSYPTTIVVSPEGEILTISPGMIDPDLLRAALNTLA